MEEKRAAPTVFDTNDELRECLKPEKTSPTVDEINEAWRKCMMSLKTGRIVTDQVKLERNIDVAILFIQKLTSLIHGKFPSPGYSCEPDGAIDFGWNHVGSSGFFLRCTIDHEDIIPGIEIVNRVHHVEVYESLDFSTEEEQDAAVERVVKMLNPISLEKQNRK